MLRPASLEAFARQVAELLPEDAGKLPEDFKKNLQLLIESQFKKMNLVTKEEFEIQQGILLKTRQKLDALEAKVAELEAKQTDISPVPTDSHVSKGDN